MITPLPLVYLEREVDSGRALASQTLLDRPEKVDYDPDTRISINHLRVYSDEAATGRESAFEQKVPLSVQVLVEDRRPENLHDEDYRKALKLLQDSEYQAAQSAWENILAKKPGPDLETKVNFYLGQSYYFNRLYLEAVLALVFARRKYPLRVADFMDQSLLQLYEAYNLQ